MINWLELPWQWLVANVKVFNALTTFVTLLVWAGFFQVFLHQVQIGRRPRFVINRVLGNHINAYFLIGNMSSGEAFVDSITARVRTSQGVWELDVTDVFEDNIVIDEAEGDRSHRATRRRTLSQGQCLAGITFNTLIRRAAEAHGVEWGERSHPLDHPELRVDDVELRLGAFHGAEKRYLLARRRFLLKNTEGAFSVQPEAMVTHQSSRRYRARQ
ncbi:hypothetical protein C7446_2839 [Kushneria sinocarnis]|uniref:Uncharacterized protein n=1 Tax=Kushneria sinocarnis TaxID=595502 RepID=A0A420WU63_9GAMM|nr:hypothetical protein [Kushneria sinocarnis]RKQ96978.1 hypothetical protein C7446_2839 [Kushneria sinocarnis]